MSLAFRDATFLTILDARQVLAFFCCYHFYPTCNRPFQKVNFFMSVPWLSPSPKAFPGFTSGVLFWPCKLWCVSYSCWRWQAVWLYILISTWQVTNGCWPATGAHRRYFSHLSPRFSQHPSRLRQPLRVAMVNGIGEQMMHLNCFFPEHLVQAPKNRVEIAVPTMKVQPATFLWLLAMLNPFTSAV